MECTSLIERRRGREGEQRRKRRVGRVSNIVKTFEQGDKQKNKITFYILKTDGHPSPGAKLCAGGARRRLRYDDCADENVSNDSDMMWSASKQAKVSR